MRIKDNVSEMLVFKTGIFDKKSGHETVHALLGECLGRQGIEYRGESQLGFGEHEKPYLMEFPDVHFNLSHARAICACLVSGFECGVDCENVRPYRPRVTERCYTDTEKQAVEALSGTERDLMFFRLWTLKEAYVKAIGIGISYPMNEAEFWFEGKKLYSNINDCTFEQYIINGRYVLSVCKCGTSDEGFVKYINTEEDTFFIK